MTKRLLAALLALMMSLTLLVGCNKDGDTANTTTTANGGTGNGDTVTTTTAEDIWGDATTTTADGATTTNGNSDGGATTQSATTTTINKVNEVVSDKLVTYTLFMTEHTAQPILVDAPKWAEITKKTNVKLEVDIGVGSSAQTKLVAAATSGKMYDITYLQNSQLKTYNSSLFMEISMDLAKSKVPNYYNLVKDDKDLPMYTVGGKYLGFAQYARDYTDSPLTTAIRYDILEKNNLPIPKTWDEWFQTMKLLKKKYPDSTPYSGRWYKYVIDYWEQALGMQHNIHYDYDSKKWISGVLQPEYREVLEFMKDCYDEGILDKGFYTCNETTFNNAALSSKLFFWIDNGMNMYKQTDALRQGDPDALMFAMPLMTNLFGEKTGLYFNRSNGYSSMYCLSSQAKDPDTLLRFMNWCYSEEALMVNSYGRENVDYKYNAKGEPYVPESVWKQYAGGASLRYNWMSKLGLGQLCFAPYFTYQGVVWENEEDGTQKYGDEQEITAADMKAGYHDPILQITPDVDLKTISRSDSIEKFIEGNIVAFIKGQRPMSEYNSFISDVKKMGIEAVVKTYNAG